MELKQAFGLITGLAVGLAGGYLFSKSERPEPGSLEKRVEAVQEEADRKLGRLDEVVGLDDEQYDELFRVMVRGLEDYRPEVNPEEYAGPVDALNREARDAAIGAVLRPEQRDDLEVYRLEKAVEIQEQWERYQLALPKNYDLLEGDIF